MTTRAHRVAEILAALDDWYSRGLNAETLSEAVAYFRRADDLTEQIDDFDTDIDRAHVVSLDGLLMKALVSIDLHLDLCNALASSERRINDPDGKNSASRADTFQRDLLRIACARGMTRAALAVGFTPEYRYVAESAA